jgi:hypothetical protein
LRGGRGAGFKEVVHTSPKQGGGKGVNKRKHPGARERACKNPQS